VNALSNARRNVAPLKPKRRRHDAQSPTFRNHARAGLPDPRQLVGRPGTCRVELLDDLRERICTHYQLALHELQREQRVPPVNAHLNDIDDPF
jgi:hypothetical protein